MGLVEQSTKSQVEDEKADIIIRLEERVKALEARLHKERNEFSKMGENNRRVFQVDPEEINVFSSVLANGDVNGDGYSDVLVTEPTWRGTGRAFLFFGGKDMVFSSPDVVFVGERKGANFGGQSGCFVDINNDGYDDVIIGSPGSAQDPRDGPVCIFHGGPAIDTQADVILHGEKGSKSRFGLTVSAADINNDGYADVLVGAQVYDQGRGRVYLFWGGEKMDTTADLVFEGEGYPEGKAMIAYRPQKVMIQGWFGRRIAAGDVNGDGYNDILIGARHAGEQSHGAAYLFLGNTKNTMDANCDYIFRGEEYNANMGSSLELFDIDNDGFDDVIVGARFAKDHCGAVYIWWGGTVFDGDRPADIVLEGERSSAMGGDDIACGDFNKDGYGDVLVGAFNYPDSLATNGRAYVFYGNDRNLMDADCDYIFDPEEITRFLGFTLSVGDINNDSYLDALIVSTGIRNNNRWDDTDGRAFLYFGPFTKEDLQDKIKAQQEVVRQVEKELYNAKKILADTRK